MCGIAGIISEKEGKQQNVQQMISCLNHRGPDGNAVWLNRNEVAALGHARLSILDLTEAGNQPMHYLNRYTIIHNGEIYNYKELRHQLQAKGYVFVTNTDTEVILAAYDRWKQDCLHHFDGMFAFAIWDEQSQKLFAARDRFGEKPFYYIFNDDGLWFASEMKAFKKAGFGKSYNGNLLLQYLANGFVQDASDAGATFDLNIKKLAARHYLEYSFGDHELTIKPYFDIDKSANSSISESDAIEKFRQLFFTSLARRLRSDVEIGTSLSGGLDSSAITASLQHASLEEGQQTIIHKVFTASFPGFEKDETANASLVARQFGLQQFFTTPSQSDLANDLESFLSKHDEPVSSSSVYAQYKVYQLAKQHGVKVILDGQGADEMLAGYSKYLHWYLQELYVNNKKAFEAELAQLKVPFTIKHKLAAKFAGWAAISLEKKAIKRQKQVPGISDDFIEAHLNKASVYKPVVRSLNDILYFDVFGGGLEELLRNADRNAMAHGIEVRLPFLNHELVQFAFSLPSKFKIQDGYTKHILRLCMQNRLPQHIVWRKDKIGFEPPQQQWMQNPHLQQKIQEAKKQLVEAKILQPSILNKPVQPKAAHEADNYDWRFLCAAYLI